jgi:hypothetical protein
MSDLVWQKIAVAIQDANGVPKVQVLERVRVRWSVNI